MLIRTHLRNTNIPILAHYKRTHTHKHTPQCRGESMKPAHARTHPCTHTHTHTPTHNSQTHKLVHTHTYTHSFEGSSMSIARSTLKLQLFLDFREIEKNCTEIEKSLVCERWGCEYIGTFDSEIKCSQSLDQIKMLKDWFFSSHLLCSPWHTQAQTCYSFLCSLLYGVLALKPITAATWNGCLSIFFVVSVSRREASSV